MPVRPLDELPDIYRVIEVAIVQFLRDREDTEPVWDVAIYDHVLAAEESVRSVRDMLRVLGTLQADGVISLTRCPTSTGGRLNYWSLTEWKERPRPISDEPIDDDKTYGLTTE